MKFVGMDGDNSNRVPIIVAVVIVVILTVVAIAAALVIIFFLRRNRHNPQGNTYIIYLDCS
jgi:heme/copper-type cytochrome/quinol oxidase subunit 2